MGQQHLTRFKHDHCRAIRVRHIHTSTRIRLQTERDIHSRRHSDNCYRHFQRRQQCFCQSPTRQSSSDEPPTTLRSVQDNRDQRTCFIHSDRPLRSIVQQQPRISCLRVCLG